MSEIGEAIRIGRLEVDSPWGNAGGVVKTPAEVEIMARTGVGWIEAGSYTLDPRPGNDENGTKVVYVHDEETGETFNSLGMPNKGMDVVEGQIPEMARVAHELGKVLFVNVAPVSEDPASESVELVERAYKAGADGVILNAGCPNIIIPGGGRHELLSRNPSSLFNTLSALAPVVERFRPVAVRVSPQETLEQAGGVVRAIGAAGTANVIFVPNTWPGQKPRDGVQQLEVAGGVGGKSGPATADAAYEQTLWFARSGAFDVISSGGIMNGAELSRRMDIDQDGYVKGGAGTTFFYEAKENWGYAVDRLLNEYAEAN